MVAAPVLGLLLLDAGLLAFSLWKSEKSSSRSDTFLLSALFLCSGMPALIYQIVWQRTLFLIYGVNSQSVAVVVGIFMLGLGLGSLLGGRLSQRFPERGILLFACAELGVAMFGLFSLRLFHWFAAFSAGASLLSVILYTSILLLLPTTLMGATLPILVEQLVRSSGSVASSVSRLYFVNTLGSAIACYLCATFLLRTFSQSGAISIAAVLNTLVGATAYLYARRDGGREAKGEVECAPGEADGHKVLSLGGAIFLAGLAGWIALGYEVAWFRVFAMASSDRAPAFALLLATYLAGIAAGSYVSELLTRDWAAEQRLLLIGLMLLISGALSTFLPPLVATFLGGSFPSFLKFAWLGQDGYLVLTPVFFLVAALLGSVLPLLCGLSISPDDLAGRRVSFVYGANILGSVLGSFVIGFVLLNFLGLREIALMLGAISVLGSIVPFLLVRRASGKLPRYLFALGTACAAAVVFASTCYGLLYERIIFHHREESRTPFTHVVENRNGGIVVLPSGAVLVEAFMTAASTLTRITIRT